MRSLFRTVALIATMGILGNLMLAPVADAQDVGKVAGIQGQAKMVRSGEVAPQPLNRNAPVSVGDEVTTDADSKLWIQVNGESHHSLGAASGVYCNDIGSEGGATFYHGHVSKGVVRFIKRLPQTRPPSSYVITTPTALIMVQPTDRAADFFVEVYNESETAVTVNWGRVKVKNIQEKFPLERDLTSCQRVYVNAGKEPSKVYGVTSEALKELIARTTIPRTLPDAVPNCEPPQARPACPCPWGEGRDEDGTCKPCAFLAGAVYDPETCECVCPCPPGSFPHPIDGSCVDECPTFSPVEVQGTPFLNPDVLPHQGCPLCECCDHVAGCYSSVLGDPTCPHPRCGKCPGPPGPVSPPIDIPPDPFAWYSCAKCCDCDLSLAAPGDPCGLNAAGFLTPGFPCGPGGRCIPRSQCLAMGGFFVRTEGRIPFRPCWVCQREEPALAMMMGKGGGCDECKRLTFRKGKPECVPIKDKSPCYKEGKCGTCRKGTCVELPPCPQGTLRNAKCACERAPEQPRRPPVTPPAKPCTSNEECRAKTKGRSPCCVGGKCASLQRCPDGKYRCRCEGQTEPTPLPEPEPIPTQPPGVAPTPECPHCTIWVNGRCLPCDAMHMRCVHGRCVRRGTGNGPDTHCGHCEERVKRQCLSCERIGKRCVNGRCVDREIEPTKCGRCEVKMGHSCVPCKAANMQCRDGRCVSRDSHQGGQTPNTGTGQPTEKRCGSCEVNVRGQCLSCERIGKACRNGHCIERTEHSKPAEVEPRPSHPKEVKPKHSMPQEMQPKPSKPVEVEPRPSHPREVQPKHFTPQEVQPKPTGR